jgi:hypothetical protein
MRRKGLSIAAVGVAVSAILVFQMVGFGHANHAYTGAKHWSDGSQPRAFVTIKDTTPASWPVLAATSEWATEPNIDVYYNFGSCGSTGHCVLVEVVSSSTFPFSGRNCAQFAGFTFEPTANGHYTNDVRTIFNALCSGSNWTNRDRRALACHELGHVMALGHEHQSDASGPNSTCMAADSFGDPVLTIAGLHEHPREHDFYALHNTVYNHNDN